MQRYFVKETYQEVNPEQIVVTGEAVHHIGRVMRMKAGEVCYLVFADEVAIQAKILSMNEEQVIFQEVVKETQEKELPIHITVASGFPKGDKLEWIVQKGTELGASQFIGFPSQFSVVKWDQKKQQNKAQRLEKIAQEAAEQSHRQKLPSIQLLGSFKELLTVCESFDCVIVAYEESAKAGELSQLVHTFQSLQKGQSVLAVFGPEGGLSPDEVQQLEGKGAVVCGLGPRILRTETAPLYLLSAASYQFELLKEGVE